MYNDFKKPKILILSLAYAPFIGGAEIAVQEITWQLGMGGEFEFDLITPRFDKKLKKHEKIVNVNVYRIGIGNKILDKYFFTFFGFFKGLSLYRKNRYQIVWPIMAAYSSFAVLFKIFTKAKVVLTLQEGDPVEYIMNLKRFKLFWPIYKLYFKKIDKVQTISNFLADWAEKLGVKKEKIIVVPNGIEINSIINKDRLKKSLNIQKDDRIILTISRLVKKNGIDDLIQAFQLLVTQHSLLNTKLLIVGGGPLENNLKKIIKGFKLEDRIIFIGEVVNEKALEYYQIADVFCRPSLSEGLGNSFLEAMANEVPVIATPVGGIPDFLKERETGWFCKVKDPQSIAKKISYILDEKNKEEVMRVVANAKKMIEEKYTWDKVAEQMKEVFKSLC